MTVHWSLGTVAVATALASSLAFGMNCSEIADDAERLACYDAQHESEQAAETESALESRSRAGSEPQATPQPELLPRFRRLRSAWLRHINSTASDGSRAVVLSTRSTDRIACESSGSERAELHIRCKDNTTSLYLVSDCALADLDAEAVIDWQVDDQSSQTLKMTKPSSEAGLGLWLGKHSIPLVRELFEANEVRIRFDSDQDVGEPIVFPVMGLEAAIGPLRKACHW
ncbi:MAG: hypothetical protein GVY22_15795 [Gammaproteobacteria bacterium]|nr:hypothetical protein [Gammaproteobacteria bacterium]